MRGRSNLPWLLLGLLAVQSCHRPAESRPNVILITLDTFRDDRIGPLTPCLSRLAGESVRFLNTVTPIGTTHPAHASLFTGRYPGGHEVRFNGDRLDPDQVTLPELLSERGYSTAGFISKRSMFVRGGLEQGFLTRSDQPGDWTDGASRIRSGRDVNLMVEHWLDLGTDLPVFLWVHYFEAHSPYPPSPYSRRELADYHGPYEEGATTEQFYAYGSEEVPGTPENRRALEALYDGQVEEVDRRVGELLDLLDGQGLLENAIVIVVGDHGQLLGEHGEVGHGGRLWEPIMRVPLMIWDSTSRKAAGVEERVSLVDLLPTVAELLDLPRPATAPGRSLLPALRGRPLEPVTQFASVRMPKLKDRPSVKARDAVAAYIGPLKLILEEESETLFDLELDPAEEQPLSPNGQTLPALERLLKLARMHQARERPEGGPVDLPPDVLEELRQFGYID
ncbi:MAG: sulfatase [Planctomycetota bacterium]